MGHGDRNSLISAIYEAAILPEKWPEALQDIAAAAGAMGAALICRSVDGSASITFSNGIRDAGEAYVEAGWLADPERTMALYLDQYPGFRAETDYRTAEELADMPVHREFLAPRGMAAGAATIFQGARDDILHITVEGFADHALSQNAKPFLDSLRPHLGRAISLTAQIRQQKDELFVATLEMAGAGAAIVSSEGRLRAANARFIEQLGAHMHEVHGRIRFLDEFLERQFRQALVTSMDPTTSVASIGMRKAAGDAAVVHLVPILRGARERVNSDGVLLLTAQSSNLSVPNANLIRLLFDLTASESVLARALVEGRSIPEIARARHVSEATVRTQMKSIFAKTGVSRQIDLVRLLAGLNGPFTRDGGGLS